jgi:hypothetical protein
VSIAATATKEIQRPVLVWKAGPLEDADAYPLPRIPYLRLRVGLRTCEPARLPPYHGSLLRGAFGHALRRTVCTMGPRQACGGCSLRSACHYVRLFEPFAGRRAAFVAGAPASPKPFVIAPRSSRQSFERGELLELDLLLFGHAVELQGFAILACERMARHGLGSRRRRFELDEVCYQDAAGEWHTGFRRGVRRWHRNAEPVLPSGEPLSGEELVLRFATPVRFKAGGRLVDRFDFRLLARRMLRRVVEIGEVHVSDRGPKAGFERLLAAADRVEVVRSDLRWHDWQRFSNRQRSKMQLGGVVGEMAVRGDLEPLSALLRTAEIVHVGKGTTFGLGKVEIVHQH